MNVCLLDLSKAFDKMDHSNWFSLCMSCVKWGSVMSHFYELKAGVRQGGVLSPILFGIYIDGLVKLVDKTNTGCKIGVLCTAIFLYADDIIIFIDSTIYPGSAVIDTSL